MGEDLRRAPAAGRRLPGLQRPGRRGPVHRRRRGRRRRCSPALEHLEGAPGRLQRVGAGPRGGEAYVDYAHTPDGLETVLEALRPHARGRLIVVFGAGGDRDRAKRPLMGEVAARPGRRRHRHRRQSRAPRTPPRSAPRSWPARRAPRRSATAARPSARPPRMLQRRRRPGGGRQGPRAGPDRRRRGPSLRRRRRSPARPWRPSVAEPLWTSDEIAQATGGAAARRAVRGDRRLHRHPRDRARRPVRGAGRRARRPRVRRPGLRRRARPARWSSQPVDGPRVDGRRHPARRWSSWASPRATGAAGPARRGHRLGRQDQRHPGDHGRA